MASRRIIEAVLKFKDEFSSGMDKSLAKFQKSTKQIRQSGRSIWKMGNNLEKAGRGLTKGVTVPIAGMAAAGVKNFGEVDKQMRLVEQTMGKTKWATGDLESAMKKAASNSVFSMNDAATASLNYARAGFDAKQSADMLAPAMNLAAGTGTDLSTVTEGLGSTLKMFGADSGEAAGYANILAQAQAQANTTAGDLFESISAGGNSFNTVGWNIKDLSVATGVLGDSMISGSEAGNAFKTGIARLASPAKDGSMWMEKLGINLFDSNGKMKSFAETQSILHNSFKGLTQEQQEQAASAIFGKNQMDKWMALIKRSPNDINKMTGALDGSKNTSKSMSDALMSGIGGSLEKLKSTFDVFSYSVGEIASAYVKPFIDKITVLLDKFNNLDEGQKKNIVKFALMAATIGPLMIGFGKFFKIFGNGIQLFTRLPGIIGGATATINGLGGVFSGLSAGLAGLPGMIAPLLSAAAPFLAIAAAIAVAALAFRHLWKTNDEFRGKMLGMWNQLKSYFSEFVVLIKARIPEVQAAFSNIVKFLTPLWEGFCAFMAPLFEGAFSAVVGYLRAAMGIIIGIIDVFSGIFTGNGSKIMSGLDTIFKSLLTFVSTMIQSILTIIVGRLKLIGTAILSVVGPVFNSVKAAVSAKIKAIVTVAKAIVHGFVFVFSDAWRVIKNGVGSAFNAIKGKVVSAMNVLKSAVKTGANRLKFVATHPLQAMKNVFRNAFNALPAPAKSAIAKVVATVVLKLRDLLRKSKDKLNSIKSAFKSKFDAIVSAVKSAVRKIKNAFNFSWKLPDLKVPKVTINGGTPPYGLGGKGSLPSFDVEWHKKAYDNAYLLKKATIFGAANGKLLGGGEGNGSELIIGFDKLTTMMRDAMVGAVSVQASKQGSEEKSSNFTVNIPKIAEKIVIREDADIDRITAAMIHKMEIAFADMG